VPVLAALGVVSVVVAVRHRARSVVRRLATGAAIVLFLLAAAVLVVA